MNNRIAAIQMNSGHELAQNLKIAEELIKRAAGEGAKLIILPENFAMMDADKKNKYCEMAGEGTVQNFLATQAKENNSWLIGGTVPLLISAESEKAHAACLMYNDTGECVARYNKIHLFDVTLPGRHENYIESEFFTSGKDVVVVDTPVGKVGLAICYDVRFPEFFRALVSNGAEIIVLPSAFTVPTGIAHWEVLIRARAIENQVYLVAAAQWGLHSNGRKTYGHSMIVEPWGEILTELPEENGTVTAEIDLLYLSQLRKEFPVLTHRQSFFDH